MHQRHISQKTGDSTIVRVVLILSYSVAHIFTRAFSNTKDYTQLNVFHGIFESLYLLVYAGMCRAYAGILITSFINLDEWSVNGAHLEKQPRPSSMRPALAESNRDSPVLTVVHIRNRVWNSGRNCIPFCAVTNKKPDDMSKLRVFGCSCCPPPAPPSS